MKRILLVLIVCCIAPVFALADPYISGPGTLYEGRLGGYYYVEETGSRRIVSVTWEYDSGFFDISDGGQPNSYIILDPKDRASGYTVLGATVQYDDYSSRYTSFRILIKPRAYADIVGPTTVFYNQEVTYRAVDHQLYDIHGIISLNILQY